jgi:hypothetical protein
MTKQTVIKSLKENPMKKKPKNGQAPIEEIKPKNEPKSSEMVEINKI